MKAIKKVKDSQGLLRIIAGTKQYKEGASRQNNIKIKIQDSWRQ